MTINFRITIFFACWNRSCVDWYIQMYCNMNKIMKWILSFVYECLYILLSKLYSSNKLRWHTYSLKKKMKRRKQYQKMVHNLETISHIWFLFWYDIQYNDFSLKIFFCSTFWDWLIHLDYMGFNIKKRKLYTKYRPNRNINIPTDYINTECV